MRVPTTSCLVVYTQDNRWLSHHLQVMVARRNRRAAVASASALLTAVQEAFAASGIEHIVAAAEERVERLLEAASEFKSDVAANLQRDPEAVVRLPRV
jgi:hypothetical protein